MNNIKVEALSELDIDAALADGQIHDTGFRKGYFSAAQVSLVIARSIGHPRILEIEAWVERVWAWREASPDRSPPPAPPSF